jgi:hypothetical protein
MVLGCDLMGLSNSNAFLCEYGRSKQNRLEAAIHMKGGTDSDLNVRDRRVMLRIETALHVKRIIPAVNRCQHYEDSQRRSKTKSALRCPPWHKGAGGKAWLFIDEIVID